MANIEDLLEKATKSEHLTKGQDLQSVIEEARLALLRKYHLKGLSGSKKAEFENMSPLEQTEKLRDLNYTIKKEHAEELAEDVAVYVLKKHSPYLASELEKQLKIKRESDDTDKKAEAQRQINLLKPVVMSIGYDWDTLVKEAGEKGFSAENYAKGVAQVGRIYAASYQKAHLDLIPEDEAHKYLKTIAPKAGITKKAIGIIKGKGRDEVNAVLADYFIANKRGPDELKKFKKDYLHYTK